MAAAVRFDDTGAPAVLEVIETARSTPRPDEVWLEQEAIGVNFLDVTQRRGGSPRPPFQAGSVSKAPGASPHPAATSRSATG